MPRLALLLSCSALLLPACDRAPPQPASPPGPAASKPMPSTPRETALRFVDRTIEAKVNFRYENRGNGQLYLPEIVGAGAAVLDADNDGDLDLFFVQGGVLDPEAPLAAATKRQDRLLRNDLDHGQGLRFTDVTASIGLLPRGDTDGYGMGVATGDFDNDGWVDLYVTAMGPNRLLRNRGDGTFEDVTDAAGADDPRWSVSASFADFDGDGWLDLFVGNYVAVHLQRYRPCYRGNGALDYCGPGAFAPQANRLLRNRTDGTFEDVTEEWGLTSAPAGPTLGTIAVDIDGDGRLDLYEANDQQANRLWINQGDGRFEDRALLAGCAVNGEGQPEASMGIDAGDVDGDGDLDLLVTHLTDESHTLYANEGNGFFRDVTTASGLGPPSWRATGFGIALADFDGDGWLDALVANGAVKVIESLANRGDPLPLHQPNQIFRNQGDGTFADITPSIGPALVASEVSRGVAVGDLDNDGDIDAVVANNTGPSRLLINQSPRGHSWIGLRLLTRDGQRDAISARAEVRTTAGHAYVRYVYADGSYASARDPRIVIGLGDAPGPSVSVRVTQPDGTIEQWDNVSVGAYQTLVAGTGQPAS